MKTYITHILIMLSFLFSNYLSIAQTSKKGQTDSTIKLIEPDNNAVGSQQDSIKLPSPKSQSRANIPNIELEQPTFPFSQPQANPFQRFITHEIAEYNGTTDISIPLYEMKVEEGFSIPITLVYHSGGVKYNQMDGDFGVGWCLNVGGYSISKSSKGRLDEEYHHFENIPKEFNNHDMKKYYDIYKNTSNNLFIDRLLTKLFSSIPTYADNMLSTIVMTPYPNRVLPPELFEYTSTMTDQNCYDSEYDQYTYNLPTTNGHFIITNGMTNIYQFENNNDKIKTPNRYYDNNKKSVHYKDFQVIDNKGFIYTMSNNPISIRTSPPPYVGSWEKTFFQDISWPLERITTPSGKTVQFKYIERLGVADRRNRYLTMSDAEEVDIDISRYLAYPKESASNNDFVMDTWGFSWKEHQKINYHSITQILTPYERLKIVGSTIIIEAFESNSKGELTATIPIKYIKLEKERLGSNNILKRVEIRSSELAISSSLIYNLDYYNPPSLFYNQELYPDNWGYYADAIYTNSTIDPKLLGDAFLHKEFLSDLRLSDSHINKDGPAILKEVSTYYKNKAKWVDRYKPTANFYSLKSITYPTGAVTNYIYEPHEFYAPDGKIMRGGGQRIKKIISKGDNIKPKVTSYEYCVGKANMDLTHKDYATFHRNIIQKEHIDHASIVIGYYAAINRTYSEQPNLAEAGDFKIQYSSVQKIDYFENDQSFLTSSNYIIPDVYETTTKQFLAAPKRLETAWHNIISKYIYPNVKMISIYRPGYKPVLKQRKYYNSVKKLIKQEEYEYDIKTPYSTSKRIRSGIRAISHHTLNAKFPIITGYTVGKLNYLDAFAGSLYQHSEYFIQPGGYLPKSSTITTFDHSLSNLNNPTKIVSSKTYTYNEYNQPLVTSIKGTDRLINEQFSYLMPNTIYADPILQDLSDRNMFNTLLSKTITSDNTEIGNIKYTYRNDLYRDGEIGVPRLSTVQTSNSTKDSLRKMLSYDKYDERGNLVQFTGIDGITVSYVWAYNWRYPIIEAKNVDYETLKKELNNLDFLGNTRGGLHHTSNIDFDKLSGIRNEIPEAQITIYQFKPSVGIVRIIDPKGISNYYEYNDANKLYRIKDHDNSLLKEYFYHTTQK